MNLSEQAYKGDKAKELLDNEVFSDAMSNLRSAIKDNMWNCPLRDEQALKEYRLMAHLLDSLEANIRKFINDGTKARFEIEMQKKREEQARKIARAQGR